MFKNRDERKRQKELEQLVDIADAFIKARGVYPQDYDGFLQIAGQKQVDLFYATMHIIEKKSEQIGHNFSWYFDQTTNEWTFVFTDLKEE